MGRVVGVVEVRHFDKHLVKNRRKNVDFVLLDILKLHFEWKI